MAFIQEYWRGKGALWKVFWLYGVLLSTGLAAIIATAGLLGWVVLPGLIAMLAGLAVYTGWILVSVWRCAENIAGNPFNFEPGLWTWLARWLTVAWAINVAALSILLVQMSLPG